MSVTAPDLSRWAPWRPEEVAQLLVGVAAPWYVAGGDPYARLIERTDEGSPTVGPT